MNQPYYTYRIRVANISYVQVEKRDKSNIVLGEPFGKLNYEIVRKRIQELQEKARNGSLSAEEVEVLGESLFTALFDEALRFDFFTFYEGMRKQALLRIELDIDEKELPHIAALPWEFMKAPYSVGVGSFWIATEPNIIFSRRRSRWSVPPRIKLQPEEKLRIVLVVSTPTDLGIVKYDRLVEALNRLSIEQADKIELLPIVTTATKIAIDELLEKQKPHIVHFIGHGRLKDENSTEIGQIALVGAMNLALWMKGEDFSQLLNRNRPAIVLLQACEGGSLSSSKALVGLASSVVEQNVPVVVAMQYEVSNNTAQAFAIELYKRIASGDPIDKAVQEGRLKVGLGQIGYSSRDFATPVLFMRTPDGYLFDTEVASIKKNYAHLESVYKLILDNLKVGRLTFFLGSDTNLCGRPPRAIFQPEKYCYLPTYDELAQYLASGLENLPDKTKDPVRVSQYISLLQNDDSLKDKLRSLFDSDYPISSLHQFLAKIPILLREKGYLQNNDDLKSRRLVIITSNYDDVLERSFKETGQPFHVVSYIAKTDSQAKFWHWQFPGNDEPCEIEEAGQYTGLLQDSYPVVLKICGSIDRLSGERDSFVISEDHFINYLSSDNIEDLLPKGFHYTLKESRVLFLGYNLRDWNSRVILHKIWGKPKLKKSWAVQLKTEEVDKEFWRNRNVDIIPEISFDEFIEILEKKLQALPQI